MQLQLRALANENGTLFDTFSYKNEYLGSLSYSYPWKGYAVGAEVDAGRDVFGSSYFAPRRISARWGRIAARWR